MRLSNSFCPRVLLRPAPPGEASSRSFLPLRVRKSRRMNCGSAKKSLATYIGNRCEATIPSSRSVVTATACSQANTIFTTSAFGSTQKTRLSPSDAPVTGALWNIPFPWERMPIWRYSPKDTTSTGRDTLRRTFFIWNGFHSSSNPANRSFGFLIRPSSYALNGGVMPSSRQKATIVSSVLRLSSSSLASSAATASRSIGSSASKVST